MILEPGCLFFSASDGPASEGLVPEIAIVTLLRTKYCCFSGIHVIKPTWAIIIWPDLSIHPHLYSTIWIPALSQKTLDNIPTIRGECGPWDFLKVASVRHPQLNNDSHVLAGTTIFHFTFNIIVKSKADRIQFPVSCVGYLIFHSTWVFNWPMMRFVVDGKTIIHFTFNTGVA